MSARSTLLAAVLALAAAPAPALAQDGSPALISS